MAYSVSRLVEALETRPVGRGGGVAGGWWHRLDRCSHKVVVLEGRERLESGGSYLQALKTTDPPKITTWVFRHPTT